VPVEEDIAMQIPRFGVLTMLGARGTPGYVMVDRHTGRIIDGVYTVRDLALDVAAFNEACGEPPYPKMTPDAAALALRFPRPDWVQEYRQREAV
jgi:hypothetical protein